jgi:hypothetical protein
MLYKRGLVHMNVLLLTRSANPLCRVIIQHLLADCGFATEASAEGTFLQSVKSTAQLFHRRTVAERTDRIYLVKRQLSIDECLTRIEHRGLFLQEVIQFGKDLSPHHSFAFDHNASSSSWGLKKTNSPHD